MAEYVYLYILASKGKRLYIGVTSNLERRTSEHKAKLHPTSFTARYNIDQLVYFERFHKDEAHWWKTRLAPLLAFVSQAYVVYLLFTNIDFLGAGAYPYANWLGPIDAVVVLAGVGTAFYFKKYKPAKYEQAGRLINEGL